MREERTCPVCASVFWVAPWQARHPTKYKHCTAVCGNASRQRPLSDRFWAQTRVSESGCVEWTGPKNNKGYGRCYFGGTTLVTRKRGLAHKIAWLLTHGPIPGGRWVLHRCDNRACCNPEHLYLGDVRQNAIDAIERERFRGKATLDQKIEGARRVLSGELCSAVAASYGVTENAPRKWSQCIKSYEKAIAQRTQ